MNVSCKKYFIHLDSDNFFVSCELVRYPHLRNTPVVVGRERGAAVAMNGPAKKLGVTRGMSIGEIRKYFKGVTVLPSHFESYRTFSKRIGEIISLHSDTIEPYSIDEYFFEYETDGDVAQEMTALKDTIHNKLGITVSIGISTTKVLAKLATSINKPDGVTHINENNKYELLSHVSMDDIWGIGRRSAPLWKNRGYRTAADFLSMSAYDIEKHHRPARELIYEIQGVSRFGIHVDHATQKTYQSTESFLGSNEQSFVYSEISRHVEILCRRLWQSKSKIGYISVMLRTKSGQYKYSNTKFKTRTDDFRAIFEAVETLFERLYNTSETYTKTGVTFGSTGVDRAEVQVGLFDEIQQNEALESIESTNTVRDIKTALEAKFGLQSVYAASAQRSYKRKKDKLDELQRIDPYVYGLPLPYLGKSL